MYLDEHWTSDIAMGIFLGILAGQKVIGYSHDHPDNRIDRALLRPRASAVVRWNGRGMSMAVMPF